MWCLLIVSWEGNLKKTEPSAKSRLPYPNAHFSEQSDFLEYYFYQATDVLLLLGNGAWATGPSAVFILQRHGNYRSCWLYYPPSNSNHMTPSENFLKIWDFPLVFFISELNYICSSALKSPTRTQTTFPLNTSPSPPDASHSRLPVSGFKKKQ